MQELGSERQGGAMRTGVLRGGNGHGMHALKEGLDISYLL